MKRASSLLVGVATAVSLWATGCQTESVSQVGDGPREAIAYAATARYPGNAESEASATVARDASSSSSSSAAVSADVDARPPAVPGNADRTSPAVSATADASPYRLAVVDRRGDKQIEILNLSDTAVPASTLWVNGLFVHRLQAIPPRGTVKVKYSNLLESGRPTGDLKQLDQNARKVELQIGDRLHRVEGPAIK